MSSESVMSNPYKSAPPPLGCNMPVSTDIRVLFPAPLWPSRAVICPSYTLNEMPSNAFNNGFFRPCLKCLRILLTLKHIFLK